MSRAEFSQIPKGSAEWTAEEGTQIRPDENETPIFAKSVQIGRISHRTLIATQDVTAIVTERPVLIEIQTENARTGKLIPASKALNVDTTALPHEKMNRSRGLDPAATTLFFDQEAEWKRRAGRPGRKIKHNPHSFLRGETPSAIEARWRKLKTDEQNHRSDSPDLPKAA